MGGIAAQSARADPILELRDSNGHLLAGNDDWRSNQEEEISATGIPPHDDREAAILTRLTGGNFTVLLRGDNNSAGVGLVEVYRFPES